MSSFPPGEEPEHDVPAVLAIAYDDQSRAALAANPVAYGSCAVPCASFREAQEHALVRSFSGILVDLVTMVKAKDEEKVIAHTLTELYPTLRVKSMGNMLIPMIMPGNAKQDSNLKDFFFKTCASFTARPLRQHRRRDISLPVLVGDKRGTTLNLSWGGAFILSMHPERYQAGEGISVTLMPSHDVSVTAQAVVVRIQPWGERRPPGIGIAFGELTEELHEALLALLRVPKDEDRDKLVT
ncbi:MAG: PilZ domain-containing protein [Geobacter sp.]|nr:MAG: PilZ domain-containing protein [Geobacter sp.]